MFCVKFFQYKQKRYYRIWNLSVDGGYRIALIFHGSKFSRIAVLKEFIETVLQIRVAHALDSAVAQIIISRLIPNLQNLQN